MSELSITHKLARDGHVHIVGNSKLAAKIKYLMSVHYPDFWVSRRREEDGRFLITAERKDHRKPVWHRYHTRAIAAEAALNLLLQQGHPDFVQAQEICEW